MEVSQGPTGLMASDGSVASADRLDQLWDYIKAFEDRLNDTICIRAEKNEDEITRHKDDLARFKVDLETTLAPLRAAARPRTSSQTQEAFVESYQELRKMVVDVRQDLHVMKMHYARLTSHLEVIRSRFNQLEDGWIKFMDWNLQHLTAHMEGLKCERDRLHTHIRLGQQYQHKPVPFFQPFPRLSPIVSSMTYAGPVFQSNDQPMVCDSGTVAGPFTG